MPCVTLDENGVQINLMELRKPFLGIWFMNAIKAVGHETPRIPMQVFPAAEHGLVNGILPLLEQNIYQVALNYLDQVPAVGALDFGLLSPHSSKATGSPVQSMPSTINKRKRGQVPPLNCFWLSSKRRLSTLPRWFHSSFQPYWPCEMTKWIPMNYRFRPTLYFYLMSQIFDPAEWMATVASKSLLSLPSW